MGLLSTMANDTMDCCIYCNGSPTFTGTDLVVTACLCFIAGIALVLLILFIMKLKRGKKLCFKEPEEPFKGKWEGASKTATIKVLKKHTLERALPEIDHRFENVTLSNKENEESSARVSIPEKSDIESAVLKVETEQAALKVENELAVLKLETEPIVLNAETESTMTKAETGDVQKNTVVVGDYEEDADLAQKQSTIADNVVAKNATGNGKPRVPNVIVSNVLKSEVQSVQLFEKARQSSVYEHDDFMVQNDNFRMTDLTYEYE